MGPLPAALLATVLLTVPPRYESVVLRTKGSSQPAIGNLRYEGNNLDVRGDRSPDGLVAPSGEQIAERWRALGTSTRGLFVLRDSLFCQQDHPLEQLPFAFMLPPSWVTSAVSAGKLEPAQAFAVEDDKAWSAIRSAHELFGSFPVSPQLFAAATASLKGAPAAAATRTRNARTTMLALSRYSSELTTAARAGGREEIIRAGAELIAQSDVRYFTAELRRRSIIPIFVENPTANELREGKSHFLIGRKIDKAITDQVRNGIYRRRLEDGDLAIERYDLSNQADVRRAVEVLEGLIPKEKGASGQGDVWLWTHGRLVPKNSGADGDLYVGEDATKYVVAFRELLAKSNIDLSRLHLVSKPSVAIADLSALDNEVARFERLGLPLSTFLTTDDLLRLLSREPQ